MKNSPKSSSIRRDLPKLTGIVIFLFLILILPVNILVQMYILHANQQESAQETFGQLEQLLETNQQDIARGVEEFTERVIRSAHMTAYFVEHHPETISSLEQSRELAEKLGVDEIHFFTPEGEIFAGTNPEYYGYTFSSGEQMSFFLPMLEDRTLALCQEITPNTAEGKEMQYAAVWMDDGSGIVQIGMEPRHLQQVIEEKSLEKIVSSLPLGLRGYLHVLDKNDLQIVASTEEGLVGTDMSEMAAQADDADMKTAFHQYFQGERYCVYLREYGDYFLIRTYLSKYPMQEVLVSSALLLLYFIAVSVAVIGGTSRYIDRKLVRNLTTIVDDLKKYGTVTVDEDMVIVCVVGDLEWDNVGFEARIVQAMKDVPVRMISYGGSNYNVSLLIKASDKTRALQALSDHLFNNKA